MKTREMGLSDREKSLMISLAVWIEHTNVTNGQTDGHTTTTASTVLTQKTVGYEK